MDKQNERPQVNSLRPKDLDGITPSIPQAVTQVKYDALLRRLTKLERRLVIADDHCWELLERITTLEHSCDEREGRINMLEEDCDAI